MQNYSMLIGGEWREAADGASFTSINPYSGEEWARFPRASVWTNDLTQELRMSRRLQAGTVWVNTYRSTSYTTPFGGYKRSGLGRENGSDAIKKYLQPKSVWLAEPKAVENPFIRR